MSGKGLVIAGAVGGIAALAVVLFVLNSYDLVPRRAAQPGALAKTEGPQPAAGRTTSGHCSPIVADSTANNIAITLNCTFGGGSFNVELIRATLACNIIREQQDKAEGQMTRGQPLDSARDLFRRLQSYHDEFVYVDLFVHVGAGCGLNDVKAKRFPKWGVVYSLDLDGFTGNRSAYEYGYQIDFDKFVDEIAPKDGPPNRMSTLLFPKDDGAFFSARFGNIMALEGLAKVKISDAQGFQFIELVPAVPIGGLAEHYTTFKRYMKETYQK